MIPAFEIENNFIPGTPIEDDHRFPEFFEIVFSDGYYSVGVPTSEEQLSWGAVKLLYR